jgi:hypothetical protein
MKKTTLLLAAFAALFVGTLSTPAFAEGKEITITGQGKCAKCAMHQSDKCQNVVQVEENGKTVTYYLTGKTSKDFHGNLCQETKKVTATGSVKEKDGKSMLSITKIEVAK